MYRKFSIFSLNKEEERQNENKKNLERGSKENEMEKKWSEVSADRVLGAARPMFVPQIGCL